MINVEFVCLGNICRSPLAEAIFKQKILDNNLTQKIKQNSSGTAAYHIGKNPDPRTIEIAMKNNIPISHKGRQFNAVNGEDYDYILAMDSNNYYNIIDALGYKHKGLFLMRHFDPIEKGADVPDPYYGDESGFKNVYDILDRSIDTLSQYIFSKHSLL